MNPAHNAVAQTADDLRHVWQDAIRLRMYHGMWNELAPVLGPYVNAAHALWDWYRTTMLVGCRRIVDSGKHSRGLIAGLDRLANQDLGLTWEHVTAALETAKPDPSAPSPAVLAADDAEQLREVSSEVKDLVDRSVAHLDRRGFDGRVQLSDLDELITEVLSAAQRWGAILLDTHLDNHAPRVTGARPMRRALELFDWEAYTAALFEAEEHLGWAAGRQRERERLEGNVEVVYRFSDVDQDLGS